MDSIVTAGSGVTVRQHVVEGHPARVMLDGAQGASLLVVGSRGHGGFTEMLLGSVSQHCVQPERARRDCGKARLSRYRKDRHR